MKTSGRYPGMRRVRTTVAGLVLAAVAAGCAASGAPLPSRPSSATLAPGSPLLSRTLHEGDAWLRHHLMNGDHDAAIHLLRRSAARPGDRLLQSLQEAVVLHHSGRFAESNRAFDWAEQEADRRYTRSVRRGIGSLVINDRVLAYMPSPGELAIIPYYRMLNYLAMGRLESAVVEARKSSAYLARLDGRRQAGCAGFGLVQYLAGHVYAAAGERNDALVSMRHAERSFRECDASGGTMPAGFPADLLQAALALGVQEVADSVAERYGIAAEPLAPGEADLIVLIEHGFAAHRAQQDLYLPILADELLGLDESDGASALAVAGLITARLATALVAGPDMHRLWDQSVWNLTTDHRLAGADPALRAEIAYVLRLAWPVMRLEASRAARARVIVGESPTEALALEDVSARLVRDLESRRNAILARAVARGVVKFAVSREAEEKAEKEGGRLLGALIGFFTNTAANALEQADTRSWSLLPDQISVARVRVPAGEHDVRIEVVDGGGMTNRIVDLGPVRARPGERVFLSHRVWGADAGDRQRLIDLGIEAYGRSEMPRAVAPPPVRRASRARPPQPGPAVAPPAPSPTAGTPPGAPRPPRVPVGAAPPPPLAPPETSPAAPPE
jgi:uncharacterized protein